MGSLRSTLPAMLLAISCLAEVHASNGLRTVALTGWSPANVEENVGLSSFYAPSINDDGRVAFLSRLTGSGITENNDGIVLIDSDFGLWSAVREGDSIPGSPEGDLYDSFPLVHIGNDGRLINLAYNKDSSGEYNGENSISTFQIGSEPSVFLRTGQAAPGAPAGLTIGGGLVNLRDSSGGERIAVASFLAGESGKVAVYVEDEFGKPTLAALSGEPLVPQSELQIFPSSFGYAVNDSGEVAFRAGLSGSGVTFADNAALLGYSPTTGLSVLMREGDPIGSEGLMLGTSTGNGDFIRSGPFLNPFGELAAVVSLVDENQPPSTVEALLFGDSDSDYSVLTQIGELAPGTIHESLVSNMWITDFNDTGQVALALHFRTVDAENPQVGSGIFLASPDGTLNLVAEERAPAPGLEQDVSFSFGLEPNAEMNNQGQLLFLSRLTGEGVNGLNDQAIYVADSTAAPELLVREGDTIDVSDDPLLPDWRTIGALNLRNFGGSALNDRGQVAFHATFTDGTSGIFVSNAFASLHGDFNGDGNVDGSDFLSWQRGESPVPWSGDDLAMWQANLGEVLLGGLSPAVPSTAIPEPLSLCFLLLGLLQLATRRRR